MALTEKTKTILSQKLRFTDDQIGRLEGNPDLQKETLSLIDMVKRSPDKKEVKQYVQTQFRKIRASLTEHLPNHFDRLKQARSEYYTFKRIL